MRDFLEVMLVILVSVVITIALGVLIVFCVHTANDDPSCRQPSSHLVSTEDGIRLYEFRANCDAEPVYFSKSGTHWNTQEMRGKSSVTVHHNVPDQE